MRWIDLPPVWLLGALLAVRAIARVDPLAYDPGRTRVVSVVLVVAALALMLWAVATMARRRTTVIPHRAPAHLVTTGPFALSRNPIYLADAAILLAAVHWWGTPSGLIVAAAFPWLIARRFIAAEEARLAALAGPDWTAYAARVRRWL